MSAQKFAAVIPAYNAEDTVEAALDSVLAQTRGNWEAIVIDDGSTDRTPELCRAYSRDPRVKVVSQENRGLPAARNAGIRVTGAPYVAFLDSDDMWMPDYLARMGAALDRASSAGLAYTDAWALDEGTRRIRRASAMSQPDFGDDVDIATALMRRNFMFVGTTVRRSALEQAGVFNEGLRSAEDYEMWLRILAHGWGAVQVPGRLAIKMERPSAMSRNEMRMWASLREVCRLVIEEHPAPEEVKAIARQRAESAQRHIDFLERASGPRWALRRARLLAGRMIRTVAWPLYWHRSAPSEVAASFPDLR